MTHAPLSRHHPHIKYLDHKELDALYWSVFIKGIGDSFISIFTAIYLLNLGYSLRSVGVFYIIYFIVLALFARASMQLAHDWGVKKTLALGTITLIIYYALLGMVGRQVPYQFVAVVYGLGASLYWSAFQLDLTAALRVKSSGRALSNVKIFTIVAGIVGPVVGALFIVKLSFIALFVVVGVIFVCSLIPLLRRGDYRIKGSVPTVRNSLQDGTPRKAAMYLLYGMTESAVDILWPVFLFLHYPKLISVGGIISMTSLGMLGIIYLIGKFADDNPGHAFKTGVTTNAPTWIVRLALLSPGGLLMSNFLGSATGTLVTITVDKIMYHDARVSLNTAGTILFRTYYAAVGRIAILGVAVLTHSSTFLFVMMAVVTLLQLVGSSQKRQQRAVIVAPNT